MGSRRVADRPIRGCKRDAIVRGHPLLRPALLERLNHLISKNNQVTVEVLHHLGEVDARRLFADEGFSSMFAYCITRLGMCGAATGRRIAAARAGRRFPLVLSLIGEGRLHLTGAALLAKHLTEDNHRQMLETACGMSKRQIETILADLAPKPDVPDRIRKVRRPSPPRGDTSSPTGTLVAVPLRLSPTPPPAPLGQSRFKVQFTASKELVAKLEKAKALLSHRVPDGDMAAVFEEALEALIDKVEKDRFAVRPSRKRKTPAKAKSAAQAVVHANRAHLVKPRLTDFQEVEEHRGAPMGSASNWAAEWAALAGLGGPPVPPRLDTAR